MRIYTPGQDYQWNWISLIGPDARDFLHRLTTIDVKNLKIGQGASGCFLSAQGQIRAYFSLWNYRPDEYAFEFAAGQAGKWKKSLLATIDQFTFAEKIILAPVPELDCRWLFFEENEALLAGLQPWSTSAIDEEIRLCHHGKSDFGMIWVTAWGRPARMMQWINHEFPEVKKFEDSELESRRILALRPKVDSEITETTNPLEVGLIDSVSQNKGCYPGQEVIERTLSLGAPARRLARIDGRGPSPQPGESIFNLADPPQEVGKITSVTPHGPTEFSALALIRKIHAKEGLAVKQGSTHSTESTGATIVQIAPFK